VARWAALLLPTLLAARSPGPPASAPVIPAPAPVIPAPPPVIPALRSSPSAWPRGPLAQSPAPPTCLGVALTRHHVLTTHACLAAGGPGPRVRLADRPRKVVRGAALPWPHPALALVGLDRGLGGGAGLQVAGVGPGEGLTVRGPAGEVGCSLGQVGVLACGEGEVEVGAMVTGPEGGLVGLVGPGRALEPVAPALESLGRAVAADLASRHRAGGRAVLRCRSSDSLAAQLLLASHVAERMQGDGAQPSAAEMGEVVRELKEEVATRDRRLESLEAEAGRLRAEARELREELKHKEGGVAQLKAQLEYQCLGRSCRLPANPPPQTTTPRRGPPPGPPGWRGTLALWGRRGTWGPGG
jgi:hypothetical protein